MAQFKAQIALSTSSVSSEIFTFDLTKLLSVKNPAVQVKTADIATGSDTAVVTPAATQAAYTYVYNKDTTNYISVKFDGDDILRVGPGEVSFFCVHESRACVLRANTAQCKAEFGYFTLDVYR
tara:strand:- start:3497 stop:3865 length:369 start_codon:yes stop_codon:yes gene_type:complete